MKTLVRAWKYFALWQEPDGLIYRNHDGDYIATKQTRRRPGIIHEIHTHEIAPELAHPNDRVCCIGFSKTEQKWYGWSHRAIVGFSRGDRIFEADYGDRHTLFLQHGPRVIRTFDDGRESAINFARYVN